MSGEIQVAWDVVAEELRVVALLADFKDSLGVRPEYPVVMEPAERPTFRGLPHLLPLYLVCNLP